MCLFSCVRYLRTYLLIYIYIYIYLLFELFYFYLARCSPSKILFHLMISQNKKLYYVLKKIYMFIFNFYINHYIEKSSRIRKKIKFFNKYIIYINYNIYIYILKGRFSIYKYMCIQ